MKSIYRLLLTLTAVATLTTSCLEDDDEIVGGPECVITNFSIGDIDSEVTVKLANGSDTTIIRTIGGGDVAFNVDHINNKIYSVDSLPNWADLSKVIPTISTTGFVFVKEHTDTLFNNFTSGSDTIDFTKPVQFLVVATDGVSTKEYTAQIFKKDSENDSITWQALSGVDLQLEGPHRTLALEDRIYVFSEKDGQPTVTSTSYLSEGKSWRKPAQMTCEEGTIDWNSVTVYKDKLYALNDNGNICQSTNDERGETWTVVSDRTFGQLLGADGNYIYTSNEYCIWASTDLQNWTEDGNTDMNMLPETCITMLSYTSKTNPSIRTAVMCGLTTQNSDNAVTWYKVSSTNNSIDQEWNYIQVTAENEFGCPRLENFSATQHKGEIYAIGGNNEGIYISADNGISWHLQTKKKMLPAEIIGQDAPTSIVSGNGQLWLIQSGGKVWAGKIG